MKIFTRSVKKGLAHFLLLNFLLPMIFLIVLTLPASAEGLTKDDAYRGLLIAAILVMVAKVAKAVFADNATPSTPTPDNDFTPNPPPSGYSTEELEVLARVIYAESRGEPYEGQVAVGAVVLNRVDSPNFPNTIWGVVYAPNQFTSVTDGQINLTPNETAYKAAREALAGKDPTFNALFFYNPKTARNQEFFKKLQVTVEIGNHVFLK